MIVKKYKVRNVPKERADRCVRGVSCGGAKVGSGTGIFESDSYSC